MKSLNINFKELILVTLILILTVFLRFYALDQIPPGLNEDEASQGYDAYSLMLTGKDQWGKSFPILLRSFGSFQSPLYTYLTIIPTYLFDISIFSTRFISALSGVLIVFLTYLIIKRYEGVKSYYPALFSAFILAISPWAIFFSRNAIEANLALAIFLIALYLFLKSFKNPYLLPASYILLGISTYAYHAQRVIAAIFIVISLFYIKPKLAGKKMILLISIALFLLIQTPQFLLLNTPAATRRLTQVGYIDKASGNIFEKGLFISRKFSAQFSAYLSPKNLFNDPDPQEVRSIPNLSVFYGWMVIPFIFGIREFIKRFPNRLIKLLTIVGLLGLLPASLTTEPFYTMRVLPYLWAVTVIIGFGAYFLLGLIPWHKLRIATFIVFFLISVLQLFISYFIFLKQERGQYFGFPYIELAKITRELRGENFIVDTSRDSQLYILLAFYTKYDPAKFQQDNGLEDINKYYYDTSLSKKQIIGNIELREINWADANKKQFLVGDYVGISDAEVRAHNLYLYKEFKDLNGDTLLRAFKTAPASSN